MIRLIKLVEVFATKLVKSSKLLSVNSLNINDLEGMTDTTPQQCSYFSITNLSWQQK